MNSPRHGTIKKLLELRAGSTRKNIFKSVSAGGNAAVKNRKRDATLLLDVDCGLLLFFYYDFFMRRVLCPCRWTTKMVRYFGLSFVAFFSYIVVVFCLLLFFRFFTFLGSNIALCHYRLYRVAPTPGKIGIWCFLLLFYPYFQVECFRFKSVFVDFMSFVLIMKYCRVTLDI